MIEPTESTLRRWLLGQLPASEAEHLERTLLEDNELGQRLRDAENDLLDDFARERLQGDERAKAATYFEVTPNDRARLRVARALASAVGSQAEKGTHHPRTAKIAQRTAHGKRSRRAMLVARALASACAVLVAVVGVRVWRSVEAPDQASAPPFTITLTGGAQRGAAPIEIVVPRGVASVRVQAEVDGAPAARYALRIDGGDAAGYTADRLVALSAGAYRYVESTVPVSALAPGRHDVRIFAEGNPAAESSWVLTARSE